jgi:hypothetical protein
MSNIPSLFARRQALVVTRAAILARFQAELAPVDGEITAIEKQLAAFAAGDFEPALTPQDQDPMPTKSIRDYLLWLIRQEGDYIDFGDAAQQLFGNDSPGNRQRLYRSLANLRANGAIRRTGRRQWEIRPYVRLGRPPKVIE